MTRKVLTTLGLLLALVSLNSCLKEAVEPEMNRESVPIHVAPIRNASASAPLIPVVDASASAPLIPVVNWYFPEPVEKERNKDGNANGDDLNVVGGITLLPRLNKVHIALAITNKNDSKTLAGFKFHFIGADKKGTFKIPGQAYVPGQSVFASVLPKTKVYTYIELDGHNSDEADIVALLLEQAIGDHTQGILAPHIFVHYDDIDWL